MARVRNITRMLDAWHVPYTAHDLPNDKLGAQQVANILGVPAHSVFKTIVVTRNDPSRPLLVLVPGDLRVDLKLVAAAVGEKKVHLPSERDAERLTGLQAGGISPLALIGKGFHVLIDSSAERIEKICVSAGERGLNLCLRAVDLARLTKARFAAVAVPRHESG